MDKPSQQELLENCQKLMARGFAHEIRNPLQALQLGLDHLQSLDELHPHAQVVDEMARAIDRIDSVARGLLDISYARLQTGGFDLVPLVHEVTAAFSGRLQDRQTALQLDLPESLPITADRRQIRWVLDELLDNAIAAGPPGATILIRLDGEAGDVHVLVRNSHARIAEEDLQRLFDPFFTTAPPGKGSGLGLCRVRKVMNLHQGQVSLCNNPDSGVDCRLILPREPR